MKRIALILLAISACAIVAFLLKNTGKVHGKERLIWYQKAVDGEFTNHLAKDVLDKFGNPESKHPVHNGELWNYGPPSMDDLINAKGGAVIGIAVHVNKYGGVIDCTGSYKTK